MNRLIPAVCLLLVATAAQAEEAGGLTWKAPESWQAQPERPMRVATYLVPAAKGDSEGGELAVFYFGPGQGGSVEANIQRWLGQFKRADGSPLGPKDSTTKKETLNGLSITTLEASGTYSGGGPMMGASTPKPGWRLQGAIIEGPEGPVFFKLTGPDKTVAGAQKAFRSLLSSVRRK